MKTKYIILVLLSLVIGKEIQENDDDIILKASGVGGLAFKGTITTSVSTIYNNIKSQAGINLSGGTEADYNTDGENGRFISKTGDGYVVSIYFHKNKKHYASCDGGLFGGGSYRTYANAGQWAVAYCKAGWAGKKTNYGDS